MSFNFKYSKYKQKYLDLKKFIGGGIPATYIMNKANNTFSLHFKKDGLQHSIIYNYNEADLIGRGGFGKVYKITKFDSEDKNTYILKIGDPRSNDNEKEGEKSEWLKDILDLDSIVLFQGNLPRDFLISNYNGNDLEKEYTGTTYRSTYDKILNIGSILGQILELVYKLNTNMPLQFYHNDIKIKNIVIKDSVVRLIDFGMLQKTSNRGTSNSMSYKSVIKLLHDKHFNSFDSIATDIQSTLKLKDTDIFGFFYCCIDLLLAIDDKNSKINSLRILNNLGCVDYKEWNLYNLFRLYYFILPTSDKDKLTCILTADDDKKAQYKLTLPGRIEYFNKFLTPSLNPNYENNFNTILELIKSNIDKFGEIKTDTDLEDIHTLSDIRLSIDERISNLIYLINVDLLNMDIIAELLITNEKLRVLSNFIKPIKSYELINFDKELPQIDETIQLIKQINIDFDLDYDKINLYRYIVFIYNYLIKYNIHTHIGEKNLLRFLMGISECLLPSFQYDSFTGKFTELIKLLKPK